jgi:type IV pilus assembly protein PilC
MFKRISDIISGLRIPFIGGVSLTSKLMFARNLKVMVSAGITLPRALSILGEQSKSGRLKRVLAVIKEKIMAGTTFSSALEEYPDVFSELFVSMIRVGEETGALEDVLVVLIRHMEKDHELRSRIKSAMIYPCVIIFAMLIIGFVMLVFVIPKLTAAFKEMNVELPVTTKITIALGDFATNFWYLLPVILIALFFLFRTLLATKVGKTIFGSFVIKIPIIGKIARETNSAYTTRTLSSLISAGVPIVRSLEIVSSSLSNVCYRNALTEVSEEVRKGAKFSEAMAKHKNIYPIIIIQMIEVGGETGETAEILKKLADFFEEEVLNATRNLSTIIEPLLMLVIGAVVAFFAISMIQPIYGMMNTL